MRAILPERVFGRSSVQMMLLGRTRLPMRLPRPALTACRAKQERDTDQPSMLRGCGGACQGAGVVGVVVGLTAGGLVLVVGVVVLCVLVVVLCLLVGVVVLVVDVARVVVVVVVVVGAVLVAVVVGVVVVTVVVGLVFFFTFAETPKNVVGWPLPVMERPARRSGSV